MQYGDPKTGGNRIDFELTDDYHHIVRHTYMGDAHMRDFQHYCAPGRAGECVDWTVQEIFGHTVGEVMFYAAIEKSTDEKGHPLNIVHGFAVYDMGGTRLFNFGVRIDHRKGRTGLLEKIVNFRPVTQIRVWDCNDRDIKKISALGMKQEKRDIMESTVTFKKE